MHPVDMFIQWFEDATNHPEIAEANAMLLATATPEGLPSARVVLLKQVDRSGFVFFTNMESRKSLEIASNPNVSLCFYWQPLGKQVRIYGKAEKTSDAEADAYYASRPLVSRMGAWASAQSRPLPERSVMLEKVAHLQQHYSEENPPPRPPYWSGWRIVPHQMEFWQAGNYRLHDRDLYSWQDGKWNASKLYP